MAHGPGWCVFFFWNTLWQINLLTLAVIGVGRLVSETIIKLGYFQGQTVNLPEGNLFAAYEEIHSSQHTWPRMFRKKLRGGVAAEVRHRGWSSWQHGKVLEQGGTKSTLDPQLWAMAFAFPIGSMYAIYGNIYHQYTPNVSIYTSTMDPMGLFFVMFRGSGTRTGGGYRVPNESRDAPWHETRMDIGCWWLGGGICSNRMGWFGARENNG